MRLYALTVPAGDVELVSDRCWEAGAAGIWERDEVHGAVSLRVGVEDVAQAAFLAALADEGPVDVTDDELVALASRTVILGTGDRAVRLEVPPTVFGDGLHPTTATCLGVLAGLVSPGTRVLDVGCGSGALSIVAARAGAVVTAIDVDPVAVEATRANASNNGVAVEASTTPLAEVAGTYDVVVANLSAQPIIELADELRRVCAGTLVVSGILTGRWDEVRGRLGGSAASVHDASGWITASVTRL